MDALFVLFIWICIMLFRITFVKNKHLSNSNDPIRFGCWYCFLLKKKGQWNWSTACDLRTKSCTDVLRGFSCALSDPRDSTAVRNEVCQEARGTAPFPSTNPWILHRTNPNLFCQHALLHLSQFTGSTQQNCHKTMLGSLYQTMQGLTSFVPVFKKYIVITLWVTTDF